MLATRFLLLLLLLPLGTASAQLMVHPTRIVLEGAERSAQLEIINNSDQPASYQLSLVNRRMDQNGVFSDAAQAAPGELFADSMLRYSPRRVTLAPGAGQVVRIMARKPADLPAGEYRSHLLFAQQMQDSALADQAVTTSTEEFGISLIPLVGVSIPIIVREGEISASTSLENVSLVPVTPNRPAMITMDMHRAGTRSVYGDITVNFTSSVGIQQQLARAGGVAVYTPNTIRHVSIPLDTDVKLSNGTLTVTYQARPDDGGALLAQASLTLR